MRSGVFEYVHGLHVFMESIKGSEKCFEKKRKFSEVSTGPPQRSGPGRELQGAREGNRREPSERSVSGRRPCLVSLRVDGTQRKVTQHIRRSQTPEDLRRWAEEEVEEEEEEGWGRDQRGREE